MKIIPLNTDVDGCAFCIKAGYYKMGVANFIGHTNDGFKATCILEIMDKRLNQLLNSGIEITDTCMLDTYNQQMQKETSCTIRTNINTANHHFIAEVKDIKEPIACAMRGRNPDNPSERARSNGKYRQRIEMGSNISNTITSVQKDSLVVEPICLNSKVGGKQPSLADRIYDSSGISTCVTTGFHPYIAEPQVLTPKRTDFGKQVRKQYESGELDMSRHDMTELEPREDGVCNTLTSVQKDNLVAEPLRIPQATEKGYIEVPVGGVFDASYPESKTRRGRVQEGGTIAPTLMASGEGLNLYEGMEHIVLDDYNQRIPQDQDTIGTITCQCGNSAPRHGYKIIEPCKVDENYPHVREFDNPEEAEAYLKGVSVHPNSHALEFKGEESIKKDAAPALRATDYKAPHCVWEQVAGELKDIASKARGQNIEVTINEEGSLRPHKMDKAKSGCSEFQVENENDTSSTLISARPNMTYGATTSYRIRKLTPRECYRLMGVSESDIDKIQQSGISNSQQYKMAGNSIVVDVLYYIFKNMFIEDDIKADEHGQLSLF